MTGIAIYMEGGGDSPDTKAAIRNGMGEFLREIREQVRRSRQPWKIVPCGGRQAAFDAFMNAQDTTPGTFNVLLVDSEEPVRSDPIQHLQARDGWQMDAEADRVHLMTQVMEAWIIADADALQRYYGQEFQRNALPQTKDLESVSKDDLARKLEAATRRTTKGAYHKIRHAGTLLGLIDPSKARSRCRHCNRLFEVLGR